MAELDIGLRRDLVAKYADEAHINWAHIAIPLFDNLARVERFDYGL